MERILIAIALMALIGVTAVETEQDTKENSKDLVWPVPDKIIL